MISACSLLSKNVPRSQHLLSSMMMSCSCAQSAHVLILGRPLRDDSPAFWCARALALPATVSRFLRPQTNFNTRVESVSFIIFRGFGLKLVAVLDHEKQLGYVHENVRFMMGYLGYTRSNKLVLMCVAAVSALVAWRNEPACKVYVSLQR